MLLKRAEEIAINNNFKKMAVISGIGVREYYKKQGYHIEGTFMVKSLYKDVSYYYKLAGILFATSIFMAGIVAVKRYNKCKE
jgi:hypothetical protein